MYYAVKESLTIVIYITFYNDDSHFFNQKIS